MPTNMSVTEAIKLVVDAHTIVREYDDPDAIKPAIAMAEEPTEVRMARYILSQAVDLEWLKFRFGEPEQFGGDLMWRRSSGMYPDLTFRVVLVESVYVQVERVLSCGNGEIVRSEVTPFKRGVDSLVKFYFLR